jgi:hypothetical protein
LEVRDEQWDQTSDGKRWYEAYEKSKLLLAEENKQRAANGQPPRVIREGPWEMNRVYFPDITRPPKPETYSYDSRDFTEAMLEIRQKYKPKEIQAKSGLGGKQSKHKVDFSFNVIHFREVSESRETSRHENTQERFTKLTSLCQGEYETIAGLEAIKSSVSGAQ